MNEELPNLFAQAIESLEKDHDFVLAKQSEDPKDALRCYPRTPADGAIDWSQDAENIIRLVNASSEPFAGAFCSFEGKKFTIWRAELHLDEENYLAAHGQVADIQHENGSIILITGKGKIKILEAEVAGERAQATHFIKSIRKRLTNGSQLIT